MALLKLVNNFCHIPSLFLEIFTIDVLFSPISWIFTGMYLMSLKEGFKSFIWETTKHFTAAESILCRFRTAKNIFIAVAYREI